MYYRGALTLTAIYTHFNPFPNNKFLDSSKLKELADDNLKRRRKWQNVLQMCRKHCEKRRNCSSRAISPISTVFSKDLYCRHVKTMACLEKGSHIEEKGFWKTLWEKVKLLKMIIWLFSTLFFCAICILKSSNSHISIVVCRLFKFGIVSKWCIREWVKQSFVIVWLRYWLTGINLYPNENL